jgi:hypothetical protein
MSFVLANSVSILWLLPQSKVEGIVVEGLVPQETRSQINDQL